MTDPISTIIVKIVPAIWSWLIAIFKRPEIPIRLAPENVFEHLKPNTSIAKARELLGVPTRETEEYLSYKFKDAFIQVNTKDGKSISALCVVLPRIKKRATFKVYPLSFILGKSSMNEASWSEAPTYEYDSSSKHHQFLTKQYFGYDGHYLNYIFGVISAPHIYAPDVEWHCEEEGEMGQVVSQPSEIIPNMVCVISGDPENFIFDFWAFH